MWQDFRKYATITDNDNNKHNRGFFNARTGFLDEYELVGEVDYGYRNYPSTHYFCLNKTTKQRSVVFVYDLAKVDNPRQVELPVLLNQTVRDPRCG